MRRYKRCFIFCLLILLLLLSGCQKRREKQTQFTQDIFVEYETKNVVTYAVSNKGNVYVATRVYEEEGNYLSKSEIVLEQYDETGTLLSSNTMEEIDDIMSMTLQDETIYFLSQEADEQGIFVGLYTYDVNTNEYNCIKKIYQLESVKKAIYVNHRIYLLGTKANTEDTLTNGFADYTDSVKEYELMYFDIESQELLLLNINHLINMTVSDDGTLILYGYVADMEYCLMSFDEANNAVKIIAKYKDSKFDTFAIANQDQDIIYIYNMNSRGIVISNINRLDEEAELYQDAVVLHSEIYCVNGNVYCSNWDGNIISFSLSELQAKNQTIRYIVSERKVDAPYGCGYTMERNALGLEQFTLKVLALDTDYDLCLIDTNNSGSYDLIRNGVFYPLNELAGMKEYLSSCYPYVKEAVTDSEGEIWGMPIEVNIPGLLVNETYMSEHDLSLSNPCTYEEILSLQSRLNTEQESLVDYSDSVLFINFMEQFFLKNESMNTDIFRDTVGVLQTYREYIPDYFHFQLDYHDDFIFSYCRGVLEYSRILMGKPYSNRLEVYPMPRLELTDPNVGSAYVLAVNPHSDRLADTLSYLESYIAYQMERKDELFL